MRQSDKQWALQVLGLGDAYTGDDLDRAYAEAQNLWLPHAGSSNTATQKRGREELEQIERAKAILCHDNGPEQELDPEEERPHEGWTNAAVGALVVAAFLISFGAMYLYRRTHQPKVHVMVPQSVMTSNPKAHLNAPDISVSSQRLGFVRLSREDESKIQADLARLGDDDPAFAINDLESLGEKALPAVTAALGSLDDNTRMNAATIINSIAAGPDDDPSSPQDAAKLRPAFDDAGTVRALERLANDPVDDTRQNVAYALGNIGDQSAFDTLIRMANDSESSVREGVAYSLGKLNNSDGLPTLTALLGDDDSSVRMSAASALGTFHNEEAHSALTDRLKDETDSDVIAAIQTALGTSNGNQSIDSDGDGA